MATVSFTDAGGVVEVSNLKPVPADRFTNWTPDALPIGPTATGLGTGVIHTFTFREDYLVSFQIVGIPATELDKLLRLQTHLLDGYLVALDSDHEMNEVYALCSLAPETEPTIEFSDRTNLEYTFSCKLKAVAEADVPEDEVYYPPGGIWPPCADPQDLEDADSFYADSFQEWPLGTVDPTLWGDGAHYSTDPEDRHPERYAMLGTDPWSFISYYDGGDLDGEPEAPNITIECSTMNGVNVHTMRQTKSVGDTRSYYGMYAFMRRRIPGVAIGNSDFDIGFDNQWASMRFRFSDGFMFRGAIELEQEYIWLLETEGTSYPDYELADPNMRRTLYDAHLVTGYDLFAGSSVGGFDYPLTGGLEVMMQARTLLDVGASIPEQFHRAEIITAAELMSGNPFRIVTRSFHDTSGDDGWRFQVWKGDAFGGALTLVYNNIMLYGTDFAPIDRVHVSHITVNETYSVPDSGSQYFEITHPEWADGQVHANPYGVP
jgi:hypothetical protein